MAGDMPWVYFISYFSALGIDPAFFIIDFVSVHYKIMKYEYRNYNSGKNGFNPLAW